MTGDLDASARGALVDPETAGAYRRFLAEPPPDFDPYYAEERARFELRDGDVIVHAGDLEVSAAACGVRLSSARAGVSVDVCGPGVAEARAVARIMDGVRSAGEVRRAAGVDDATWSALARGAFGKVWFAPLAVAALEARVPFAELVRYPASPYEVVRTYWENQASVAERLAGAQVPATTPELVDLLRRLHALSLVGTSGRSFYRPGSAIARKSDFEPGQLLLEPTVTEPGDAGVRFVSGPRVGAGAIGGERYQSLLLASLTEYAPPAPAPDAALSFGHVAVGRADGEASDAPWFCLPRPLVAGHFDAVRAAWEAADGAARSGDPRAAVAHLSALHWRLVRLHPFPCANQCLAMSVVNSVLRRVRGQGTPHLVLDHLALRLSEASYAVVFERAVRAFASPDPRPVQRTMDLGRKRRLLFAFLGELASCATDLEAAALAARRPEAAALAFLR